MIVVLFRSRLTPEAGTDYRDMAEEMLATARTMPGFIDFKSYKAEDGERLSVVWWQDETTMAAWKNHPLHRIAQENGRSKWYSFYEIEVAEVVRTGSFVRGGAGSATPLGRE
jgi:heme-degrading monooxygenase HmoA